MRFCIPIPCFYKDIPFEDAARKVKTSGFDAMEIYGWKHLDLDAARAALDETGVELLSMCTTEFAMTSPDKKEAWLAGLAESCEAAKKLGARKLITQAGQDTGEERPVQHERIVDTLKAAAPILDTYGVTVMIEPLNTYVDHPGYYLWQSSEAFAIIREVGHPLVKVVYDIYHQQIMEGNIIPSITNNLDCIAHLHAAGHPGRIDLQFGESDYKNIFAAADKAGYTGACGLEYRPTLGSEESLQEFKRIYL